MNETNTNTNLNSKSQPVNYMSDLDRQIQEFMNNSNTNGLDIDPELLNLLDDPNYQNLL